MSERVASLYERLGGIYSIAAVIDDFIDRVMGNPILNANPLVAEAHGRVSAAGFKYLVTEFVCGAIGGPQVYSGKSMVDAHVHLRMTNKEWDAFITNLEEALYKFDVPDAEHAEVVRVVQSLKGEMSLID